jgi:uncharacterized protein YodC (DUF2158 family)
VSKDSEDSNVVAIGRAKRRLKPGDIVQLLTGGCKMVVGVAGIKDSKGGGDYVDCYWFGKGFIPVGHLTTATVFYWSKVFPVSVLKRVKP